MIWVGIDPGKNGGYSVISESETGKVAYAYPWDNEMFVEMMESLTRVNAHGIVAVVEKVGAMPGQGVTSMFNFGKSAGFIEGTLSALDIPYQLVPPATWKKEFGLIGKDKKASIEVCRKLFPAVSLKRSVQCRTYSDGMAEALLMAEYARRKL